ncbi:MAG: nitrogenase [Bacteroidales bacterium]|nr:nitrogenase [Bacteroidales bacterium]MBN2817591.1 nitrogenase [Bacteroidales bacterium]
MLRNIEHKKSEYTATRNACKLCSPLGASLAYKGIKACVPIIHGSQGCATYIRRYLISHYREPFDIASSSFSEEAAVFGGQKNLNIAISNIIEQYKPEIIGICTTCLSETIGEDLNMIISDYKAKHASEDLPEIVHSSTPSYQGTHADGFHETVKSLVAGLAKKTEPVDRINLFSGFVSPADLRHLKEIMADFSLNFSMIPDYSESVDNPNWSEYKRIPDGGTPVSEVIESANAYASVELGYVFNKGYKAGRIKNKSQEVQTAGEYLESKFNVINHQTGLPIGIKETDKFFDILEKLSGNPMPGKYEKERGRLIDAYVDGHKIMFGKKAIIYGEEDLVIGLSKFLAETGIDVVLAVTGGNSGKIKPILANSNQNGQEPMTIGDDMDFEDLADIAKDLGANIMIGNSKGYYIARELKIPLVRVGFPVHDRFGAQRIHHLSYRGTQELFDRIANALMEYKQENSAVGYKYL